jgi:curli biogenesis system outer membrane secretion channel CsgG
LSKKLFFILALVILAAILAFPTLGAAANKFKIAVLPFDDGSIQGKDRWWREDFQVGKGVSDELVTEFLNTGQFRLIEREQLEKIMQEQDLGAAGRVDAKSAAKIGKILGVQFLVIGRVTEFTFKNKSGNLALKDGLGLKIDNTSAIVAIDARLVDSTTAEIIAGVTGKGNKKETNVGLKVDWNSLSMDSNEFRKTNLGIALRDAVASVAKQLAEKAYGSGVSAANVKVQGSVAYVSGSKVIINVGSADGVKEGMIFVVKHVVDVVKDPDTGEVIDEVTEKVAEIIVGEVKEKSSTCTVTLKEDSKYGITVKDRVNQKGGGGNDGGNDKKKGNK